MFIDVYSKCLSKTYDDKKNTENQDDDYLGESEKNRLGKL